MSPRSLSFLAILPVAIGIIAAGCHAKVEEEELEPTEQGLGEPFLRQTKADRPPAATGPTLDAVKSPSWESRDASTRD